MGILNLLNFMEVADILKIRPDQVRMLVIEERRLAAMYVTHAGASEPYQLQLLRVESDGRAFDMAIGGIEGSVHTGFLRVERAVLDKFIRDEGWIDLPTNAGQAQNTAPPSSVPKKKWTSEKLAELKAYREAHTMPETAEKFGISEQRIRELLPGQKPKAKPFAGLIHRI